MTATGIAEDDRDRIFETFRRLDGASDRSGTGLGLALVAQQAREHAATVHVDASPEGGARVDVAFGAPDGSWRRYTRTTSTAAKLVKSESCVQT